MYSSAGRTLERGSRGQRFDPAISANIKDIPSDSYLYDLPVVRHLQDMEELPISRHVTFLLERMALASQHLLKPLRYRWALIPKAER
ncbi:MAG TPA: hypothetical protein VM577_01935 [Anaerovoracaceae bacterium]|nr:hypothetical protein [Anaerovoracaceae bacterium]